MSENDSGAARPRVLVYGLTEDEVEALRPFAGSLSVTDNPGDTHPEEHDVLILTGAEFHHYDRGFPRRISFAPPPQPLSARPRIATASGWGGGPPSDTSAQTQFKPARDFEVTSFTREQGLESLVLRSCLPVPGGSYSGIHMPVRPERAAQGFLRERLTYPLTLAALLETEPGQARPDSVFWLPDIARAHLTGWLVIAFARWRVHEPDIFPVTAEWKQLDDWGTRTEIEARRALIDFDLRETERRIKAADSRKSLTAELDRAEVAAESWRALLSETGEDLVAAVKGALEFVGFSVIDSDELPEHKGKKREDLRVIDGEWLALVEVKGYVGSAKSNDLLQLTAASATYAAETGRIADALWYVPNVYREIDPAQRETALAGREDDLVSFGDDHNGCLIDTRALFDLRQLVALSKLSAEQAREDLKTAVGRFKRLR